MSTVYACFINLDRAHERRACLENCFKQFAPADHVLRRIAAIGAGEVGESCAGTLLKAQKACIQSHIKALRASLEHPGHALILEDDAALGPVGFNTLSQLLDSPLDGSDLIFLNSLITRADFIFITQYQIYRRAIGARSVALLDPRDLYAAGADAYIVNKDSKGTLLALLEGLVQLDVPYDLLLKDWVDSGTLKAKLALPFVTSLSVLADRSQITAATPDWNRFRRLYALDSEFHPDAQVRNGVPPERAVDIFTDEHLKFLKLLLTTYATYE